MKKFFCLLFVILMVSSNFVYVNAVVDKNLHPNTSLHPYYLCIDQVYSLNSSIWTRKVYYFDSIPIDKLIVDETNDNIIFRFEGNVSHGIGYYDCVYNTGWSQLLTPGLKIIGISKGSYIITYTTNLPAYNSEGNRLNYQDYYIQDKLGMLSSKDIYNLHTIEKQFEKTLDMQFFIKTDNNYTKQMLESEYNVKLNTGRGAMVVVYDKSRKVYLLACSKMFLLHGFYDNNHIRLAYDFKFISDSFNLSYTLQKYLTNYIDRMVSSKTEYDLGYKGFIWDHFGYKCHTYTDTDITAYALKDGKLGNPTCNNGFEDFIEPVNGYVDDFGFTWDGIGQFPGKNETGSDDNHIWEIRTQYTGNTPTPTNTSTPIPSNVTLTPTPTPTPIESIPTYVPVPLEEPPGQNIDWKSVTDDIYGKLPFGSMSKSLLKLQELKDSNEAPVIKINLHPIEAPVVDNLNGINPFKDEEMVMIDFSFMENVKFLGISIRSYFKGLVGAFVIIKTVFWFINEIPKLMDK